MRRTEFVVRVWQEGEYCWGQIIEPLHEWKGTFRGAEELWRMLSERLEVPPQSGGEDPSTAHAAPDE